MVGEELQSAMRVVQTLEYLATNGPTRVSELAVTLGVHKSNALRLLTKLRTIHWVATDDTGALYQLGPALLRIGHATSEQVQLNGLVRVAEAVRDLTEESVHIAIPDGDCMLLVARVDSPHALRVSCELYSRDPMHTSSLGKAYLSALPKSDFDRLVRGLRLQALTPNSIRTKRALRDEIARTRERGYAIDDEEGRAGVCCLGVPMRLGSAVVGAAMSVTGPHHRWTLERISEMGPRVMDLVGPLAVTDPSPAPVHAPSRRAMTPSG